MTKEELIKILEAAEKDAWCMECGELEIAKVLIILLPKYNIDVPEWLADKCFHLPQQEKL